VFHGRSLEEGEFALDETSRGAADADGQRDERQDDGLDGLELDEREEDGQKVQIVFHPDIMAKEYLKSNK